MFACGRANLVIQNGAIANCDAGVHLGSDTANTNSRNHGKGGLASSGKYKDNATFNVTTPFLNGVDAGGNN